MDGGGGCVCCPGVVISVAERAAGGKRRDGREGESGDSKIIRITIGYIKPHHIHSKIHISNGDVRANNHQPQTCDATTTTDAKCW